MRRYNTVDAMRGIGIVLVVLGHALGISQELEYWIFSFHMPLFFFLFGYVLKPTRLSAPFAESARHYAQSLLLPYMAYSFLAYIPWVLFTRHYRADAALNVPAWTMLWFFPCLFLVHLLYRGVAAGNWLTVHDLPQFLWGKRIPLFLPLLLGIHSLSIYLNGRVDMNFLSFGNPILFYIGAFAGIGAIAIAVSFLSDWRIWNTLAKAAIVIFPLHRLFFSIVSATGLLLFQDFLAFKTSSLASLVYTLAAVLMGIALAPIIRRFFPILMGGRA